MLLSVLQATGAITAVSVGGAAGQTIGKLTIAAAIQNFIICIEMFFAAIAFRYAFPYKIYRDKQRDRGTLCRACYQLLLLLPHGLFLSLCCVRQLFYSFM